MSRQKRRHRPFLAASRGGTLRPLVMVVETHADFGLDLICALRRSGHRVAGPFPDEAACRHFMLLARPSAAILNAELANADSLARTIAAAGVPIIYHGRDAARCAEHSDGLFLPQCDAFSLARLATLSIAAIEGVARASAP